MESMSRYEEKVWASLNTHWERRNNRRGLPNWASSALTVTGDTAGAAARKVGSAVPDVVRRPAERASEAVTSVALRPALEGAVALLELVNKWCVELNSPAFVEKAARKQGIDLESFTELGDQDLKVCDRMLGKNTLAWTTFGAAEGGAMGLLALVPVAGVPVAITADILVIQVLSTSIAARIAYSYGFDAKDPEEQDFIRKLVERSFIAQAARAGTLNRTAQAATAIAGRQRWSANLRADHHLIAALEQLLKHLGPAGARVPVGSVAKAIPVVGVLIGAGTNSAILGNVAADAKRYCQTRFLCEKYGLPMPAALKSEVDPPSEVEDVEELPPRASDE